MNRIRLSVRIRAAGSICPSRTKTILPASCLARRRSTTNGIFSSSFFANTEMVNIRLPLCARQFPLSPDGPTRPESFNIQIVLSFILDSAII